MIRIYAAIAMLIALACGGWYLHHRWYGEGRDDGIASMQIKVDAANKARDQAESNAETVIAAQKQAAAEEKSQAAKQAQAAREAVTAAMQHADEQQKKASQWQAKYQAAMKDKGCGAVLRMKLCESLKGY